MSEGNELVVVHRCEACLRVHSSTQIDDDVNVTGIVVCPSCGRPGSLNPEVINLDEVDSEDKST